MSQVAWLHCPHLICSPLIHELKSRPNSHPLLSVINIQLIISVMVWLMLNHKTSSQTSTVAPTPQDKKKRCNLGHTAKASKILVHEFCLPLSLQAVLMSVRQQPRVSRTQPNSFTVKGHSKPVHCDLMVVV